MRWYDIALYIAIINILGFFLASHSTDFGLDAHLFTAGVSNNDIAALDSAKNITMLTNTNPVSATDPISSAFGFFYQQVNNGANYLFQTFPMTKYLFWMPILLENLGVGHDLSLAIWFITSMILITGMIQFITGRNVE